MIVVPFGAPGTGKSTHGRYIADRLGIPWISAGEVLRQVARRDERIAGLLDAGELVPSEEVDRLMRERLSQTQGGFVLDGYPRTVEEARSFLEFLADRSWRIDRVFEFRAPEPLIMERLQKRGRTDDRPDVIRERLRVYRLETEPVLEVLREAGAEIVEVDTAGSIEEVQRRLDASMQELVQQPR